MLALAQEPLRTRVHQPANYASFNQTPWIQNCSHQQLESGRHRHNSRTILIQLTPTWATTANPRFEFLDSYNFKIAEVLPQPQQIKLIAQILKAAQRHQACVVVQCSSGLGLSPSICEAAQMLDFDYIRQAVVSTSPEVVAQFQKHFVKYPQQ